MNTIPTTSSCLQSQATRDAEEIARLREERDEARDKMIAYGLHNATLRQSLRWSVDAMQTWFSSEYLEHPETRKCRQALDTTPVLYKAEIMAERDKAIKERDEVKTKLVGYRELADSVSGFLGNLLNTPFDVRGDFAMRELEAILHKHSSPVDEASDHWECVNELQQKLSATEAECAKLRETITEEIRSKNTAVNKWVARLETAESERDAAAARPVKNNR